MNNRFIMELPVEMVALGRHRTAVRTGRDGKHFQHHYTPAKSASEKSLIAMLVKNEMALTGFKMFEQDVPVKLALVYIIKKPKSKRRKNSNPHPFPVCKPDLSNAIKLTEDALNKILWYDDSQIVSGSQDKRYTETGESKLYLVAHQVYYGDPDPEILELFEEN